MHTSTPPQLPYDIPFHPVNYQTFHHLSIPITSPLLIHRMISAIPHLQRTPSLPCKPDPRSPYLKFQKLDLIVLYTRLAKSTSSQVQFANELERSRSPHRQQHKDLQGFLPNRMLFSIEPRKFSISLESSESLLYHDRRGLAFPCG